MYSNHSFIKEFTENKYTYKDKHQYITHNYLKEKGILNS
jgi:hypothetical protein